MAKSLSRAVAKYRVEVCWTVTKYQVGVGWPVTKYQVEVGWSVTKYQVGVSWAVTKYQVYLILFFRCRLPNGRKTTLGSQEATSRNLAFILGEFF